MSFFIKKREHIFLRIILHEKAKYRFLKIFYVSTYFFITIMHNYLLDMI